jgi:hypothetical protein
MHLRSSELATGLLLSALQQPREPRRSNDVIGADDLLGTIDRAATRFADAVSEGDFETAERWVLLAMTALEESRDG